MGTVKESQLESQQVYGGNRFKNPEDHPLEMVYDFEPEPCGYCNELPATREDGCCDRCREDIKAIYG